MNVAPAAHDTMPGEVALNRWRHVSKPRRQGALPLKPTDCIVDFIDLWDLWLSVRGLSDCLKHGEDQKGMLVYHYVAREPVIRTQDQGGRAFHGTWWYALWALLNLGVLLDSCDEALGHTYINRWPGVYWPPELDTRRWYARPHIMFGDGVYHRIIFELRVDTARRKKDRKPRRWRGSTWRRCASSAATFSAATFNVARRLSISVSEARLTRLTRSIPS